MFTILNGLIYSGVFNNSSLKMSALSLSVKTLIRTKKWLPVSRSLSQITLKRRITRRRYNRSLKNIRRIHTIPIPRAEIYINGQTKAYFSGTLSQVVKQMHHLAMTGTNTASLHVKFLRYCPTQAGSFLSFSARWPNVISTVSMSRSHRWSPHHIPHLEAGPTLEIHSSGRVYSQPSTIS